MVREKNKNLLKTTKAQMRAKKFQFKFLAIIFLVISVLILAFAVYVFISCRDVMSTYSSEWCEHVLNNGNKVVIPCSPEGGRDCDIEFRHVVPFVFVPGLCGVVFGIVSVKRREKIAKTILVLNICVVLVGLLAYFLI